MSEQTIVERTDVPWQPKANGQTHDVLVECYANGLVEEGAELTLFFPGFGEEARAAQATAAHLALRGIAAVVAIAPIARFAPTKHNLEVLSADAPVAVIEAFNKKIGNAPDKPVNAGGHSLGGGIAAMSAHTTPELYNKLALHEPMGFTNKPLPDNKILREIELARRASWLAVRLGAVNSAQPEQWPQKPGNREAAQEIGYRAMEDARRGRLTKEFKVASSLRLNMLMPELIAREDATHSPVDIHFFAGRTDLVFPPRKIIAGLREAGIAEPERMLTVVDGSHCSLMSVDGKKQLDVVASWLSGEAYEPEPAPVTPGFAYPLGALPEAA